MNTVCFTNIISFVGFLCLWCYFLVTLLCYISIEKCKACKAFDDPHHLDAKDQIKIKQEDFVSWYNYPSTF